VAKVKAETAVMANAREARVRMVKVWAVRVRAVRVRAVRARVARAAKAGAVKAMAVGARVEVARAAKAGVANEARAAKVVREEKVRVAVGIRRLLFVGTVSCTSESCTSCRELTNLWSQIEHKS